MACQYTCLSSLSNLTLDTCEVGARLGTMVPCTGSGNGRSALHMAQRDAKHTEIP